MKEAKDFRSLAVADLLRKVEEHDKEIISKGITPNEIKRAINVEELNMKK